MIGGEEHRSESSTSSSSYNDSQEESVLASLPGFSPFQLGQEHIATSRTYISAAAEDSLRFKSDIHFNESFDGSPGEYKSTSVLFSDVANSPASRKLQNNESKWSKTLKRYSIKGITWKGLWKRGVIQSAMQMSVSVLATTLLSSYIAVWLDLRDGSIVPIAAISAHLTIEPTIGDTTGKASMRLLGTAMGGLLAFLLFVLVTLNFNHLPDQGVRDIFAGSNIYVTLVIAFFGIPFFCFFWAIFYEMRATKSNLFFSLYGKITTTILLATSMVRFSPSYLLYTRVLGVVLGILTSVLSSQLVFPRRTRRLIHNELKVSLESLAGVIMPLLQMDLFGILNHPDNYTFTDDNGIARFKCKITVDELNLEKTYGSGSPIIITPAPTFKNWLQEERKESFHALWTSYYADLCLMRKKATNMIDMIHGHRYEWLDLYRFFSTKRKPPPELFQNARDTILSLVDVSMGLFFSIDLQVAMTDSEMLGVMTEPSLGFSTWQSPRSTTLNERGMGEIILQKAPLKWATAVIQKRQKFEAYTHLKRVQELDDDNVDIKMAMKDKFGVVSHYFEEKDYDLLTNCNFEDYDSRSENLLTIGKDNVLGIFSPILNDCGFLITRIVVILSIWIERYEAYPTETVKDALWQLHGELLERLALYTEMRINRRCQFSIMFLSMYKYPMLSDNITDMPLVMDGLPSGTELKERIHEHLGLDLAVELLDELKIGGDSLSREDYIYIRNKLQRLLPLSFWQGYFNAFSKISQVGKVLSSLSMACHKLITSVSEMMVGFHKAPVLEEDLHTNEASV